MNEKAIFEIGAIIHTLRSITGRKLTAHEIIDSYEYEMFKSKYPELCRLAEEEKK